MFPNLLDYSGKVLLVTGAASGIGRAVATAFAACGASVVIGDVADGALQTVDLIHAAGGEAIFLRTDVSAATEVEALVTKTVQTYGRLDCAFNNAGMLPSSVDLADVSEHDFDRIVSIDLKGVFLCMKYEIAAMLRTGGGAIVNTASVAGVVADARMSPYAAAKHGVIGLTKAAALDYATRGIRVNALAPGLVATGMTQRWLADPDIRQSLLQNSPIGRAAQPDEMCGAVLYLCSPMASFVTGQTLLVDGGQTAH